MKIMDMPLSVGHCRNTSPVVTNHLSIKLKLKYIFIIIIIYYYYYTVFNAPCVGRLNDEITVAKVSNKLLRCSAQILFC